MVLGRRVDSYGWISTIRAIALYTAAIWNETMGLYRREIKTVPEYSFRKSAFRLAFAFLTAFRNEALVIARTMLA